MSRRTLGLALVGLSLVYLSTFVARGWVPHDEGMIGQSAERILAGGLPHVDYEEPYTGGLSLLHAAVFRLFGIDLLHLRWTLFAGASLAQLLTYLILRRYVGPIGAGVGSLLALTWSFPNYFASLPSWWVLLCALGCAWSFIRYVETERLRYAVAAGVAAGVAVLFKQTGIYLVVALAMSFLYRNDGALRHAPASRAGRALCTAVAVAAVVFARGILISRLELAEVLCFLVPIAVCSGLLLTSDAGISTLGFRKVLQPLIVAMIVAVAPFTLFVVLYVAHHDLDSLVRGLVVLPQRRLQFATFALPSAQFLLAGMPLLAAVVPMPRALRLSVLMRSVAAAVLCVLAIAFAYASLGNAKIYQVIWQAARGFGALLPIAAGALLFFETVTGAKERRILFGLISILAWSSLVQFPYSAPIYYCYVTPLAVIVGAVTARSGSAIGRPVLAAVVALLLAFAVLTMNRGYIHNLGVVHDPPALAAELRLGRAHLNVTAEDAANYRRVVELVDRVAGDGRLIAGPDCPELYFLTGRFSPSGSLFDFFSDAGLNNTDGARVAEWSGASIVVLNHSPSFSPVLPEQLVSALRSLYPKARSVGRFEVRWR